MLNLFGRLAGDRRTAHRHYLNIPIRYRIRSSSSEHSSQSENISEVGVFFETDHSISVGAILDLMLDMPNGVNPDLASLWCTGHVVRVTPKGLKRGVGVQFDCFEVLDRENLALGFTTCAVT